MILKFSKKNKFINWLLKGQPTVRLKLSKEVLKTKKILGNSIILSDKDSVIVVHLPKGFFHLIISRAKSLFKK